MPKGIPGSGPLAKDKVAPPERTAPKNQTARRDGHTATVQPARPEDLVMVRATERGEYGWAIRNVGEVFEMDTKTMRTWPLADTLSEDGKTRKEHPIHGYDVVVVTTPLGEFELPPWVEIEDGESVTPEELVPHGHKTEFGVKDGNVL